MEPKNICALICAYNEEKTISEIINRAKKHLEDVYVVDDGSTDQTLKKATEAGAIVLKHKTNLGKGNALRTGFSYLKDKDYDAVITLDADGQHLPEEIPLFINQLNKGFEVVIGKRNFKNKTVPLIRKISNQSYILALSFINHTKVHDPECGYRAFKTELLPFLINSSNKGFSYESEILIKLLKNKKNIGWTEISTIYSKNRKSKIKPIKHLFDSIKVCIKCLNF